MAATSKTSFVLLTGVVELKDGKEVNRTMLAADESWSPKEGLVLAGSKKVQGPIDVPNLGAVMFRHDFFPHDPAYRATNGNGASVQF
jgi:hypothetical protein